MVQVRKARVRVNTEKILVTREIFHGIPLESVTLLVIIAGLQAVFLQNFHPDTEKIRK